MPNPTTARPGFFERGLSLLCPAVRLAPMAPALASSVVRAAPVVAPRVLGAAGAMAAPVLANPVVGKGVVELSKMLASPAQKAAGWARAFDTVGANMVQAWGVERDKHSWLDVSTALEGKPGRTDITTLEALQGQLSGDKREAMKGLVESFPGLADSPERLGQLQATAARLSPRQLEALSGRLAAFQRAEGVSKEFKNEVARDLLADLANPLRADNACGPTCSSTSAQMRMARDKPSQYADIVLDLAQGRDHTLSSGNVIKATYGESTVNALRKDGKPATAILFQANLQHFAASNARQTAALQRGFNPLFNGGLDKLLGPKWSKEVDDNFVNKDFDRFNPLGGGRRVGHDPFQMEFLQQNLFPGATTRSWLTDSPNAMWDAAEQDLKRGKSVSASLFNPTSTSPGDKFHVVTITGIDHSSNPPTVTFHTWGHERTISLDNFKRSCTLVAPGGN